VPVGVDDAVLGQRARGDDEVEDLRHARPLCQAIVDALELGGLGALSFIL
jgi:hypothetical protein